MFSLHNKIIINHQKSITLIEKLRNKLTYLSEEDANIAVDSVLEYIKDELSKNFTGKVINIKELKPQALDKMKTKRLLYLVGKETVIPHEQGANKKFFSQSPVTILQKEKISNTYDYLIDNKDIQ